MIFAHTPLACGSTGRTLCANGIWSLCVRFRSGKLLPASHMPPLPSPLWWTEWAPFIKELHFLSMGDKSIADLLSELSCNCVLCCCMASFCLTHFIIFNSGSICRHSDSDVLRIPTTNWSRSISFLKFPYSHESISWYNTVIYSSADSSVGSVESRSLENYIFANFKYSLNLAITELYFALSVVEACLLFLHP